MSAPLTPREAARQAIDDRLAVAAKLRRAAWQEARQWARRASGRGRRDSTCCKFDLGKSRETQLLRDTFNERFEQELAARHADIEFHLRKARRICRAFGFNDVRIPDDHRLLSHHGVITQ